MSDVRFVALDLEGISFSEINSRQYVSEQQRLLTWAGSNTNLFPEIVEQRFELPTGIVYSVSCHFKNPSDGSLLIGIGRSNSRLEAASKAVGECVERFIGKKVFSESISNAAYKLTIEGEQLVVREPVHTRFHLPDIQSSNGWAVHFDLKSALRSSAQEALERHILLYSYLKEGWDAFRFLEGGEFHGVRVGSLFSKHSVAGFGAGIAVACVPNRSGMLMGYCCDLKGLLTTSQKWKQAFFEAIETALYYKNPTAKFSWSDQFGMRILEDYQVHFLNQPLPQWSPFVGEDFNLVSKSISANVVAVDLTEYVGTPFYATHVWGGDLIPLFFSQRLGDASSQYIREHLRSLGLSGSIPTYHPVI